MLRIGTSASGSLGARRRTTSPKMSACSPHIRCPLINSSVARNNPSNRPRVRGGAVGAGAGVVETLAAVGDEEVAGEVVVLGPAHGDGVARLAPLLGHLIRTEADLDGILEGARGAPEEALA